MHVDRDEFSGKFWLDPVRLAAKHGFSARELGRVKGLVTERSAELLEAWDDHFPR